MGKAYNFANGYLGNGAEDIAVIIISAAAVLCTGRAYGAGGSAAEAGDKLDAVLAYGCQNARKAAAGEASACSKDRHGLAYMAAKAVC